MLGPFVFYGDGGGGGGGGGGGTGDATFIDDTEGDDGRALNCSLVDRAIEPRAWAYCNAGKAPSETLWESLWSDAQRIQAQCAFLIQPILKAFPDIRIFPWGTPGSGMVWGTTIRGRYIGLSDLAAEHSGPYVRRLVLAHEMLHVAQFRDHGDDESSPEWRAFHNQATACSV